MSKGRLEAFSDGVLAIIITIMVLELVPPHEASLEALGPLVPKFTSYALSFFLLAIYWNNHHHLLQASRGVSGKVLWANMLLLFWLSLVPFATAWMGESGFASLPVAAYAIGQVLAAFGYFLLVRALLVVPDQHEAFKEAVGRDMKGIISVAVQLVAIPVAFVMPLAAFFMMGAIAAIWFIPDRRMERAIEGSRR